jgi:hypothetical protein
MSTYVDGGDRPLPPEIETLIESELASGEKLLWVGQPRPRRFLSWSIPIVLFGIPWTAFSVFWMAMAGGMGWFARNAADAAPGDGNAEPGIIALITSCFFLFGLPFVLIGLGMLSSPWWMLRRAKKTAYALTDRRAIVMEPGWFSGRTVRSYDGQQLGRMARTERSDGSGDLVFEDYYTRDSDGGRMRTIRGFMAIDRVREVEELVRKSLLKPFGGSH